LMIGVNVCGASSSTLLIHVMESWIFKHCFDDWSQVRE
jgi:hypothetical protein